MSLFWVRRSSMLESSVKLHLQGDCQMAQGLHHSTSTSMLPRGSSGIWVYQELQSLGAMRDLYMLDLSWSVCQCMLLKHGHFLDLPQARLKAWLATLATAVEKQEAFVQCVRKLECQWMQIQIPPNSRNFAVILIVLLQMIWQSKRYLRFYIFHFLSVHLEHWYVLVQQHPLDVRLDPSNWQVPPMAAAITLLFLHTPLLGRPSIPKHSINSIVIGDADVTCNRTIWENIRKVTSKGLFFCFRMQVVVRWFWGLWMVLKVPKQNFQ